MQSELRPPSGRCLCPPVRPATEPPWKPRQPRWKSQRTCAPVALGASSICQRGAPGCLAPTRSPRQPAASHQPAPSRSARQRSIRRMSQRPAHLRSDQAPVRRSTARTPERAFPRMAPQRSAAPARLTRPRAPAHRPLREPSPRPSKRPRRESRCPAPLSPPRSWEPGRAVTGQWPQGQRKPRVVPVQPQVAPERTPAPAPERAW